LLFKIKKSLIEIIKGEWFMEFSLFNINHLAEKNFGDYLINILGLIIIPLVIYFLSSVYGVIKKERENRIRALNSLTLYCKNLLQESLKLRNNEARRRNALHDFIKNPSPKNFTKAFYIVRTPSLQYELIANDYAFTVNQYMAVIDLIFEVSSNLKTVTTAVTEFNMLSELAIKQTTDERIKMAKEMLLQLDAFHHHCCILAYIINKLMCAVQIYNSYYFFQDIVNLEFQGRMKEMLDCVEKEMDEFYNPREHQWRVTFIENLENPPVKFSYKDILQIIYLKFCGYVDKNIRIFKKKIYNMKKARTDLKHRNAKSACTAEKIKELNEQYLRILNNYELCKEKLNSLEAINVDLNLQLYKGLMHKLKQMIISMKNIFQILPPERSILLTADEIAQVEINLNFLTTNFIPCFNNIFKFLYLYYFPEKSIEEINFISPELNKIIDKNYQTHLQNFYNSELYNFIEAYDYSISNELPFELSGALIDDKEEFCVGIKIIPNQIANENGIKEVYIYDYIIKIMQLLTETTNDAYETILKCSKIQTQK